MYYQAFWRWTSLICPVLCWFFTPGSSWCYLLHWPHQQAPLVALCLAPVCLAVSLPHQDETQANAPAELAICALLCLLPSLVGLGRSWQSVTQAVCTLLTLGNRDTTQRRHWTERCFRYSVTTSRGGMLLSVRCCARTREPKLSHSFSGLYSNLQFTLTAAPKSKHHDGKPGIAT